MLQFLNILANLKSKDQQTQRVVLGCLLSVFTRILVTKESSKTKEVLKSKTLINRNGLKIKPD